MPSPRRVADESSWCPPAGARAAGSAEEGEPSSSRATLPPGSEIRPVARSVAAVGLQVVGEASRRGERREPAALRAPEPRERLDPRELVPFGLLERSLDRRAERARLRALEIDPGTARVVERCAEVAPRPPFLWQWAKEAIAVTTLPSVDPAALERVRELKLRAAVFFTAVDDVADTLRDEELFEQILAHVFRMRRGVPAGPPERARKLRSLAAIWRDLSAEARGLPRYREMRGFFDFDCGTFLHGVAHSLLMAAMPEAACVEETWTAAFMPMFADLDLMCSPGFDRRELGAVRGVVLEAQQMVVLANALGTWEREVRAGDHSSFVLTSARCQGVLTAEELGGGAPPEAIIERIRASDVEAYVMVRWEHHWRSIQARIEQVRTVDVAHYLRGLERIFQLQMMSRGLV